MENNSKTMCGFVHAGLRVSSEANARAVFENLFGLERVKSFEAVQTLKDFLSEFSHEYRMSLAIIQGNLELMNLGFAESVQTSEIKKDIFKEIERMSTMLADLSLLAKTDPSSQELNYEKIDLNKIISSACKSLRILADAQSVKIDYKENEALSQITADITSMEKLIFNLLQNAIKYNQKNGWIKVWAEETPDAIKLKVEDSGIGIAEKHLPYIFDRFYRVDTSSKHSDSGSGLGLAICKWVAQAHGGKIDVQSTLGKGSLFVVQLPKKP